MRDSMARGKACKGSAWNGYRVEVSMEGLQAGSSLKGQRAGKKHGAACKGATCTRKHARGSMQASVVILMPADHWP